MGKDSMNPAKLDLLIFVLLLAFLSVAIILYTL